MAQFYSTTPISSKQAHSKKNHVTIIFVYSLYVLNTWLKQSHEVEVLPQSRVEGNRFSTFEVSKGD